MTKDPRGYTLGELEAIALVLHNALLLSDLRHIMSRVPQLETQLMDYNVQTERIKIQTKPSPELKHSEFIDGTYTDEYVPL